MQYSITTVEESKYLIYSNKRKCSFILKKNNITEEDYIDFYISLHLVLEVSLNAFYRKNVLTHIQNPKNQIEIIKNLDKISFLNKTILFLYNSTFIFKDDDTYKKATEYHSIINTIRDFSSVRNSLIHGGSISSVYLDGEETKITDIKKMLNMEGVKKQKDKFLFIIKGMRFYLDNLDSQYWKKNGKKYLKNEFLDDSFLEI